jgi:transposase
VTESVTAAQRGGPAARADAGTTVRLALASAQRFSRGQGVRVMVATRPVDFRKGMEGLAVLVREAMGGDPFGGVVGQACRPGQAYLLGRREGGWRRMRPVKVAAS